MKVRQAAVRQASSFFEKKEAKKLLPIWTRRAATREPQRRHPEMDKSFFGSFFSKKELLAFLPLAFLPLAFLPLALPSLPSPAPTFR
jgi:hypothetical protein